MIYLFLGNRSSVELGWHRNTLSRVKPHRHGFEEWLPNINISISKINVPNPFMYSFLHHDMDSFQVKAYTAHCVEIKVHQQTISVRRQHVVGNASTMQTGHLGALNDGNFRSL